MWCKGTTCNLVKVCERRYGGIDSVCVWGGGG